MADWYFARNGQQQGPISEETVRSMLAAGQLGGDEVVWRNGMAQWTPVGRVPEFASIVQPAAVSNETLTAAPVAYASPFTTGQTTVLTERALDMLRKTKPWARLISILIFIAAGFSAVAGLGMLSVGLVSSAAQYGSSRADVVTAVFGGIVYFVLAALYLMPGIYLTRYANRIGELCNSRREDQLEQALEAQKSFWKFTGLATLLSIVLGLAFAVIGVLIISVASSRSSYTPTMSPNAPPIPAVPTVPHQR